MENNILSGIRILDFSRVLAGPYATRLLGDFGAEVIKVQSKKISTGVEDNSGAYFSVWNRNKLSITLDMSFTEAREIALKLAAVCDVVVENFSPRVMSNWGLDYEDLRRAKKDIIMARMSGFGQTGPWRDFTAYSPTVQSLAGHTFLTSYDKDNPAGIGFSYADSIAGLYCVLATLSALEYREKTGLGQLIDLSEYESACSMLGPALIYQSATGAEALPDSNKSRCVSAAPYGCYKCSGDDRWCAITVCNETEWKNLCHVMGNPDWVNLDKFANIIERKKHESELDKFIGEWTMKHAAEEIVKSLQEANIAAGIVQNAGDLANDRQLEARKYFAEIENPFFGKMNTDVCPIRFKKSNMGPWKPSPTLGEDNQYVYHNLLGFSAEEISALIDKGVIA